MLNKSFKLLYYGTAGKTCVIDSTLLFVTKDVMALTDSFYPKGSHNILSSELRYRLVLEL